MKRRFDSFSKLGLIAVGLVMTVVFATAALSGEQVRLSGASFPFPIYGHRSRTTTKCSRTS